jgi:hypothetical protein
MHANTHTQTPVSPPQILDMDRKFVVNKCNEWMRSCDMMYMEVGVLGGLGGWGLGFLGV